MFAVVLCRVVLYCVVPCCVKSSSRRAASGASQRDDKGWAGTTSLARRDVEIQFLVVVVAVGFSGAHERRRVRRRVSGRRGRRPVACRDK